jgi:serine/threonine protein kinase
MALAPGTSLGHYEVSALIGERGMGEVYQASDTRLDRTVAIKVLPEHVASEPDLKQRFEREAKTISSLNHPHICTLYDIGSQKLTTGAGEAEIDFLWTRRCGTQWTGPRVRAPYPLVQGVERTSNVAYRHSGEVVPDARPSPESRRPTWHLSSCNVILDLGIEVTLQSLGRCRLVHRPSV